MNRLRKSCRKWVPQYDGCQGSVSLKLASALIGHTVDVLGSANSIAHGVVTGVLEEAGRPKLVVAGGLYDFNQVLTSTPAAFC